MSEPSNAEGIEQRVINLERALSTALLNAGRLARVVDEQSDRIEALEENSSRWAVNLFDGPDMQEPEPDAAPPYRMARPTSCDALVIDNGKVWRPVFGPDGMWEAGNDSDSVAWETFTDPQPFQNCTLTADDPEPPGGSVVRCDDDSVWQSETGGDWRSMDDVNAYEWTRLLSDRHPVTLLYRGEA